MKELTYHEIRIKALKNNVRDNKLQIGMWAQFNGYMKRRVHTVSYTHLDVYKRQYLDSFDNEQIDDAMKNLL